VAAIDALAAFEAVEVAEHGRRLVAHVLALDPAPAADEGVAAAGVDHVARAPGAGAVGALRAHEAPARRLRLHGHHAHALPRIHAVPGGVLEQHPVEI